MLLVLSAIVPIAAVVVLMLVFNRPAKVAMPIGWGLAVLAAVFVWRQDIRTACAWATDGFLEAIGTLAIIAGAVAIMNILKATGAMSTIERLFTSLTPDRRIQAVIVGFVFEAFLEGAAGFGTPAAIAAPLLVGLGFAPVCAAVIALILNSSPVNFGAVGVPVSTAVAVTSQSVEAAGVPTAQYCLAVTFWSAAVNAVLSFFVVFAALFVMCRFFGERKRGADALPALPFVLFTCTVYGFFSVLTAFFFGSEFPSLVGGIVTLAIAVFAAKRGFLLPRETWRFPGERSDGTKGAESGNLARMSPLLAWAPYGLVALLLVLTRLNAFGLKGFLTSAACTVSIGSVFGIARVTWKWNWGWCPGILPFLLVCLVTLVFQRCPKDRFKTAVRTTWNQCAGAGLALFFGVSMVYIYRNTGMNAHVESSMLFVLAKALADVFSCTYVAVAPLIGVLGAFMSGSNTVSNTLFAGLQYQTAVLVKLSPVLIVVLQNIGAAAGNMICVNNVVAACATTGTSGKEGQIIRTNMPVCFVYCFIAVAIVGTALYFGVDPLQLLAKELAK